MARPDILFPATLMAERESNELQAGAVLLRALACLQEMDEYMFITDDSKAVSARKLTLNFHRRHSIKSINDIELHKMAWGDLGKLAADAGRASRDVLDQSTDETRSVTENAVDAFLDLMEAIGAEKDERSANGDKSPRSRAETAKQMANRPILPAIESRNGGEDTETADVCPSLAPEQRFSTWARAQSHTDNELRGLSLGAYLRSMVLGGKTDAERRALSEGSDSAGGYTVPNVLSATLIDLARAQSVVIRAGAQTVPLTSDNLNYAKLLTDPVPAWRLEAGNVAESDPTFGLVPLVPRSLAVQVKVSAELMEDSINLATALPNALAASMSVELDRVALLGTGTAPEPRGIANTSGIGTFAQDALSAGYGNLSKARTAILTANQAPTAYIMHPRDEGEFVDLVDSNGNPLVMPSRIAEIPMLTTTSIPIDGGAGSDESTIIAGDFARLMVGIRSDIRVEVLKTSSYASNLQYTLLAHMRADVAVTHPGAFFTLTGVGQAA